MKSIGKFEKWWWKTTIPNWYCEFSRVQSDIVREDFRKAFNAGFRAGRKFKPRKPLNPVPSR